MMLRLNYVVWALLFLVFCEQAGAVEPLLMKYEPGTDKEIVKIVGVDDKAQELLLIEKSFLSKRKASFDPKRSDYEAYVVVDAIQKKVLPFITAHVDETVSFGGIARVSDGYIIPVVREKKRIELYQYNRQKGSIQRFGDKLVPKQIANLNDIYATTNGYITVSAKRNSMRVKFYPYNDGAGRVLSLLPPNDTIVSIADIIELNNTIYLVGIGQSGINSRYLWVASIDLLKSENIALSYRVSIADGRTMSAKFVRSHDDMLSVFLSERQSGFSPPVVSLVLLGDDKPVRIWEESASDIQGDKDYFVSWVCGNKLLIAKKSKSKSKKTYRQSLGFSLIVIGGKAVHLPIKVEFENSVLKDVSLYPSSDYLFSVSNFSKVEKTKRSGGWYSWYGYRVDKIDIHRECVRAIED